MHILLNNPELDLGSVLNDFKSFAQDLPADMKGLCLSNSLDIRQIHNEFGNLEELLAYGGDEEDDDVSGRSRSKDPFHFIAFIQKQGIIYELDGLKEAPLVHNLKTSKDSWTESVIELIKKRLKGALEIRFNLMTVVADRRESLKVDLESISLKIDEFDSECEQRTELLTKRFNLQQELDDEEAKWMRYRKDWKDRPVRNREIRPKPSNEISSQVQDLLKSMAQKGLIPKM